MIRRKIIFGNIQLCSEQSQQFPSSSLVGPSDRYFKTVLSFPYVEKFPCLTIPDWHFKSSSTVSVIFSRPDQTLLQLQSIRVLVSRGTIFKCLRIQVQVRQGTIISFTSNVLVHRPPSSKELSDKMLIQIFFSTENWPIQIPASYSVLLSPHSSPSITAIETTYKSYESYERLFVFQILEKDDRSLKHLGNQRASHISQISTLLFLHKIDRQNCRTSIPIPIHIIFLNKSRIKTCLSNFQTNMYNVRKFCCINIQISNMVHYLQA